jgi:uncharacterized heparinase superfamily protein
VRQPAGEPWGALMRARCRVLQRLAPHPLYRHTLIGRVPADLKLRIGQRWPGDPKRGAALLAGEIALAGEVVRDPTPIWFPPSVGTEWLAEWHSFAWLSDISAVGAGARDAARALLRAWLAENPGWHPIAWRSDILATRIFAWIVHFDELAGRESDQPLRRALLTSLAGQLRHLARTAGWETSGAARLRALKGLTAGLVALGASERRVRHVLRAFERELPLQILPDGGHRSRSPSMQLQVLRDLIDIRAVLRAARFDVPHILQSSIDRMAPMLRFFRHGDRRLALFNGSLEEDGLLVDLVLTRSESKGRAPATAPHSGFQRLQADNSLVLVDTGRPPPHGFDEGAHAGTLSFELSQGRERIVVNCGAYHGPRAGWRRVTRASAAHSALVVGDTNIVQINDDGTLGRAPSAVRCEHAEDGGAQWMSATHDGYRERFGLTFTRQFFLAADGDDLRGEDSLTGRPGAAFAIRFHLHPSVQAALLRGSSAVLLRLPSGAIWRLRAAGAEITLGESVYLGSGEARKTQQVVLTGQVANGGTSVRWAIRREPRPTAYETVRDREFARE